MNKPNNDFAVEYPQLGTDPLSVESVVSEEYFERERRFFQQSWVCIGRVEEAPNPGDYFLKRFEMVVNASLLVVHGEDRVFRVFNNICPHRGNSLVPTQFPHGSRPKGFRCKFHAWSFSTTGELAHVPDEGQWCMTGSSFDKADYGLPQFSTEVWEGFIFFNKDPNPTKSLQETIGKEFFEPMKGYYSGFDYSLTWNVDINCNWKMILDSFGETVHVKALHKFHITDTVVGPDNPDSHLLSAHLHERNRSFSTFANLTHQPTPAEAIAYKYGYATWTEQDSSGVLPPGLNPRKHEAWAFDGVVIFPNLLMVSSNFWMAVFRPIPIAVNKTRFEIDYYVTKAANAGERMCQEYARCAVRDAVREDAEILENCQENLMAGIIDHLPLSNQEVVLRHNHWAMDQALKEMENG